MAGFAADIGRFRCWAGCPGPIGCGGASSGAGWTGQPGNHVGTPFGEPRGGTVAWRNDKGLVGGTLDKTGLTHLGAREYDPGIGRFTSVDPVMDLTDPQQMNGYIYSNSNPVTFSDPSGQQQCADDPCTHGVITTPGHKNDVTFDSRPPSHPSHAPTPHPRRSHAYSRPIGCRLFCSSWPKPAQPKRAGTGPNLQIHQYGDQPFGKGCIQPGHPGGCDKGESLHFICSDQSCSNMVNMTADAKCSKSFRCILMEFLHAACMGPSQRRRVHHDAM